MKVFLRVVIVVLLLGALGLGAYAIFFKPANKDAVFLALSKVCSEENDELYETALNEIKMDEFTVANNNYKSLLTPVKAESQPPNSSDDRYKAEDEDKKKMYHFEDELAAFTKYKQYEVVLKGFEPLFERYSRVINGSNVVDSEGKTQIPLRDLISLSKLNSVNEMIDLSIQDPKYVSKEDNVDRGYSFSQFTYPDLKEALDNAFDYYFAYTQAATKSVPNSELKDIKKAISEYQTSLDDLRTKFAEIKDFQNTRLTVIYNAVLDNASALEELKVSPENIRNVVEGVEGAKFLEDDEIPKLFEDMIESSDYVGELEKRYQICVTYFREYLNDYATLIEKMSNFVTEYVFEGEQLADMDSIFYDLMVSAVKNSTEKKYSFSDFDTRKSEDMKMIDATKFVDFAFMEKSEREHEILSERYYFEDRELVEVAGDGVYSRLKNLRYINSLKLQVVNEDGLKLYFGVGEKKLQFVTDGTVAITEQSGGGFTVNIFNRSYQSSDDASGNAYVELYDVMVYQDGDNTKVCHYEDLNEYAAKSLTLIDINIDDKVNTVQFSKENNVFTSSCSNIVCYVINNKLYGINEKWEVCQYKTAIDAEDDKPEFITSVVDEKTIYTNLDGAVYHAGTFYAKSNYGGKGQSLNYNTMIKYYRSLMNDHPEELDNMMKLSLEDKQKFVNESVEVRAGFEESTHDAIAYILACFGFVAE